MGCSRSLRLPVLLLLTLILYACGFQLRGTLDLSQDISPLYIEQNSVNELAQELRSLLVANKIATVKEAYKANAQVTLLKDSRSNRVLTVDSNGRAREYLLTYRIDFAMKIKQSEEIADSISISRSLLFESEAVLAVANETEILYRDMRRDAARSILLRLQARARSTEQSAPAVPAGTGSEATEQTQ